MLLSTTNYFITISSIRSMCDTKVRSLLVGDYAYDVAFTGKNARLSKNSQSLLQGLCLVAALAELTGGDKKRAEITTFSRATLDMERTCLVSYAPRSILVWRLLGLRHGYPFPVLQYSLILTWNSRNKLVLRRSRRTLSGRRHRYKLCYALWMLYRNY